MANWDDIVAFGGNPYRSEPKDVDYEDIGNYEEDQNQQFHLLVLEKLHKHGIEFDRDTYNCETASWEYLDRFMDYAEEVTEAEPAITSVRILCELLMNDARKLQRQLSDKSSSRAKYKKLSFESWDKELGNLHSAMSHGIDGLPATERVFESYGELHDALEEDVQEM